VAIPDRDERLPDAIKRTRRRVRVLDAPPGPGRAPSFDEVPWLQPFPDRLLEDEVPGGDEPEAAVVAKETIELAFLAAVQHLPPSQRAVLILRDVLGWSASETAEALEGSVAAVNSALQRARARLRELGQAGRLAWSPVVPPTREERLEVQRYMDAHARADAAAVIELLGEDVRFSMPPTQARFEGRPAVAAFFVDLFGWATPAIGGWCRLELMGSRLSPTMSVPGVRRSSWLRPWTCCGSRAAG
jgi:RNA polymerase sigma-70 factor, ECF subfamily